MGEVLEGGDLSAFQASLTAVCIDLAKMIPDDGEGASHLITIDVRGCASREDAHRLAKTVAASPLVKTGIAGADPNWGRIVSAAGRSGVTFDIAHTRVDIGGTLLFENGLAHDGRAPQAAKHLQGSAVQIDVSLGSGGGASATIWTCDLSAEYVRINGDYRT